MKNSIKISIASAVLILFSCGSSNAENSSDNYINESYKESAENYDMEEAEAGSSQSAQKSSVHSEHHQQNINTFAAKLSNDSNLRFIREAKLTYQTESVRKTTYYLENHISRLGGIVINTNLYSTIDNIKKLAVSKDSSLQITTYQMHNSISIKIPNYHLDSLLKIIAPSVKFLDSRVVTAEEISLNQLQNQLEQSRMAEYQQNLAKAIGKKTDKLNKMVDAYESMLQKQEMQDAALIRNLKIDYNVNYSTVELDIYQGTSTDKELVENELNIEAFEPSFSSKMKDSFLNGWNAILSFIILLANFWFILFIIPIIILVYRKIRSKRQN